MRVQQLLEHHGIAINPFAEEDAQTDPVFKDHCIVSTYHPTWDKVYGDPAHYFRQDGDVCSTCAVSNLCTRLDGGYERFHGRPALAPFESDAQVEAMFAKALLRFPKAANHVRHTQQLYRQNRNVEPPTKQVVKL